MGTKEKSKSTIFITKNGITLTEGLFIIQNVRTKEVNIISIDIKNGNATLFTKTKTIKVADVMKLESINELVVIGNAKINIPTKKG